MTVPDMSEMTTDFRDAAVPDGLGPGAALPDAVLWDLDGTLMDTEPLWFVQERELVSEYGGTWTDADALSLVGLALRDSAQIIRSRTPVTLSDVEIVDRMQGGVVAAMREDGVPWRPGARELVAELGAAGVPQALVTMSWRPVLEIVLAALPGGTFTAVVTGDMVEHGKPHPEPYLRGLAGLGVDPGDAERLRRCVAIEDSTTGMTSAVRAGIPTLVTPCVKPVDPLPGAVLVPTLEGVRAAELRGLAAPVAARGAAR